eukprot:scaffold4332_cov141-Isochrysis_galbana.AAC.1
MNDSPASSSFAIDASLEVSIRQLVGCWCRPICCRGPCCPRASAVAAPASRQKRGCRGCPPRRRQRAARAGTPRSAPVAHFGRPCVQPPAPHSSARDGLAGLKKGDRQLTHHEAVEVDARVLVGAE